MNHVIDVQGLTKDYGQGRGVFGLTFQVERGEVFGFLGPNGAGKTTTIRQLMGFIRPTAGRASILGMDCFAQAAAIQAHVGYLPGELSLMDDLTGDGFLRFMANMRGMADLGAAGELKELFRLDGRQRLRKMSKGTRQKVGLVCAFMARPDLLLLDEPTSGLDPLMQSRFVELLLREKARGATILLSSHMFEELERTCDRVAILRAGRLAAVERTEDLRRARTKRYRFSFPAPEAAGRCGCTGRGRVGPVGRPQTAVSVELAASQRGDDHRQSPCLHGFAGVGQQVGGVLVGADTAGGVFEFFIVMAKLDQKNVSRPQGVCNRLPEPLCTETDRTAAVAGVVGYLHLRVQIQVQRLPHAALGPCGDIVVLYGRIPDPVNGHGCSSLLLPPERPRRRK